MRHLLMTILLVVHGVTAVDVAIRYTPPRTLTFTLPVTDVEGVVFHYHVKHMEYLGRGVQTANGWEYTTNDVNLEGAGVVSAYAVIYHLGQQAVATNHSFLSLENTLPATRAPGRAIRGATFFRDDFNNFNGGNWNYEVSMYGGYNGEFQAYTNDPKNVFTRGGSLYVYPIPTVNDNRFSGNNFLFTGVMDLTKLFGYCTESALDGCVRDGHYGILPPVMSGKVKSVPLLKFGTLEVRARIPKGDWLWPAIWMLPKDDHYGQWPRSGEIDIMESRGNNGDIGVGTVTSTLHWGPSADQNRFMKTHGEKHTGSWHNDYHTWKLEWTQDHLITYVDNQQIVNVDPGSGGFWGYGGFSGGNIWGGSKMAPFDQNFYLMFNVAVGGTSGFFPDNINYGVRKPWANNSPTPGQDFWAARNEWLPTWQGDNAALLVDYVEFKYL